MSKEYCSDCADRVDVNHKVESMCCSGCGAILGAKQPLKVHMPPSVNFSHDQQEPPAEKSVDAAADKEVKESSSKRTFSSTKL